MTWRTGRKVGRTIYRQRGDNPADGDELVGLMDTPELATRFVRSANFTDNMLRTVPDDSRRWPPDDPCELFGRIYGMDVVEVRRRLDLPPFDPEAGR